MSKTLMARLQKLEAAREQKDASNRVCVVAYFNDGDSKAEEEARQKAVEDKERDLGRKIHESELDMILVRYVSPSPGHANAMPTHGVIPDRTPAPSMAEKQKPAPERKRDFLMG